jgi:hypothetical protein
MLAAQVIQAAEGNYSLEKLAAYSDLLQKQFGNGRGASEVAASYLPHKFKNSLARFLLRQEWFCRHVVVQSWFLR